MEIIKGIAILATPIIITIIIGVIICKYVKWDNERKWKRRIEIEAREEYIKMQLIEKMKEEEAKNHAYHE